MHCIVTAGPTYEPLDEVRRLTNFSSGRLGSELASYLTAQGHTVTLLIGQQSTFGGERKAQTIQTFTTTNDLRDRLQGVAGKPTAAVFHAAAVSDFSFGQVWQRSPAGELTPIRAGKLSTRQGTLMAELVPTPKIISYLRAWFPTATLVGWKYEVDGDRAQALESGKRQIAECRTDACVVNGGAYGFGFGLLTPGAQCTHFNDTRLLFEALTKLVGVVEKR